MWRISIEIYPKLMLTFYSLQSGMSGAFGVSAVKAVMEVLDIVGESVSQDCTALVV